MRLPSKINRRYFIGMIAEYWAALILMVKGYRPLAVRYKTKVGEIDLIVKRGKVIVFVEVKYRQNMDDAAHAVHNKSQLRIRRAADHYLLLHRRESPNVIHDYRFDVVAVNKFLKINHIQNAF